MPVLCAFLLATLAACEPIRVEGAGGPADAAIVEAPRRCTRCGWIEARRDLGPPASEPNQPIVYEYTVRMADGSRSQFRENEVRWRVGERLMIIAGEANLRRGRAAGSP